MKSLILTRLAWTNPPIYDGEYDRVPVTIKLDSSAVLKLGDSKSHEELQGLLASMPARVSDAATRLIEMRQKQSRTGKLTVTISALDLG